MKQGAGFRGQGSGWRTASWFCCVVAMVSLLRSGAAADEEEFRFLGPAPVRNFQPIQLIFLNLPFERAATIGPGAIGLHLESAEINEIATTQGPVRSALKFETNRTVIGARYGLAPHWEIGLDTPFISRFGGFLDPGIDLVEGLFDVGNVERDLYPNNSFGDFYVRKGETKLFDGGKETLYPGDLSLSLKREVPLGSGLPLLAVRGAVKVPTGSEGKVTGSGKPDFGLGLAAEHRLLERLMLYLNLGLVCPGGPITPADLTLNPIFTQSFAAEVALTRRVTVLLHEAVYTSPMHGTGTRLLDGTPVEIGFGVNVALTRVWALQLLAIDDVSPVEPAADFSLMAGLSFVTG
jgi:hypothetical protein